MPDRETADLPSPVVRLHRIPPGLPAPSRRATGGAPGTDLQARLVAALGSAAAAYLDLASAFSYAWPADLVDGWLEVLAAAGADLVDSLGPESAAAAQLDLDDALVKP